MFELFSDIFACRDNVLTRVDPRVKLFAALALILAVVFSTKVFLPLAVAAVSLMAMLMLSIPIKLSRVQTGWAFGHCARNSYPAIILDAGRAHFPNRILWL